MQIVVTGNVAEGFSFFGPLADGHTVDWIDEQFDEWVVVDVESLEEN